MTRRGDVEIAFSDDGAVVRATLDRPAARNAVSLGILEGLEAALDLAEESRAKVVVLRGAGGNFCAGADLTLVQPLLDDEPAFGRYIDRFVAITNRLESGPYASLAVIEGFALAGGCELLLACDMALAAADARIGDRHLEFGLVAGAGGSVRLARALAKAQARYLLLTGEMISGTEAAAWGLVTRAVEPDGLDAATDALVDRLASRSGDALRTHKRMAVETIEGSVLDGLATEKRLAIPYLTTAPDVREGLAAFIGRRPPKFGS